MLYFVYVSISDYITTHNRYYLPSLYKIKTYWRTNNIEMENNGLKKAGIKNRTCYYFYDIINIEDFDSDNILLDEKPYENLFFILFIIMQKLQLIRVIIRF